RRSRRARDRRRRRGRDGRASARDPSTSCSCSPDTGLAEHSGHGRARAGRGARRGGRRRGGVVAWPLAHSRSGAARGRASYHEATALSCGPLGPFSSKSFLVAAAERCYRGGVMTRNREADAITVALWAYKPRRRLAMKRHTLRGFCLAVCIGAGSTTWWLASPAGAQQGFSLKSLRGEYVFALDGYTIQGDTGQHQPFAWAGKETYDGDRKSTRLNSSHEWISYAVFRLKKKKILTYTYIHQPTKSAPTPHFTCATRNSIRCKSPHPSNEEKSQTPTTEKPNATIILTP